jgi:hypothetical protein
LNNVQIAQSIRSIEPKKALLVKLPLLFVIVFVDGEVDAGIKVSDKHDEKH